MNMAEPVGRMRPTGSAIFINIFCNLSAFMLSEEALSGYIKSV